MTKESFQSLPTPRTDAVKDDCTWKEVRCHAQQLERELAVCEQALNFIAKKGDYCGAADEILRFLAEMRKDSK